MYGRDDEPNDRRDERTDWRDKANILNVLEAARELKASGLPISGWKPGKCNYCGAGDTKKTRTLSNGAEMDARVPVRKVPGKGLKMKACTYCYKQRVEMAHMGIYGNKAADVSKE